jgi:hypothetical protein
VTDGCRPRFGSLLAPSVFVGLVAAILLIPAAAVAAEPPEPPEPPETKPVTLIGATSAAFNGVVKPGAKPQSGTYKFLYKRSATECEGESATAGVPSSASALNWSPNP